MNFGKCFQVVIITFRALNEISSNFVILTDLNKTMSTSWGSILPLHTVDSTKNNEEIL